MVTLPLWEPLRSGNVSCSLNNYISAEGGPLPCHGRALCGNSHPRQCWLESLEPNTSRLASLPSISFPSLPPKLLLAEPPQEVHISGGRGI